MPLNGLRISPPNGKATSISRIRQWRHLFVQPQLRLYWLGAAHRERSLSSSAGFVSLSHEAVRSGYAVRDVARVTGRAREPEVSAGGDAVARSRRVGTHPARARRLRREHFASGALVAHRPPIASAQAGEISACTLSVFGSGILSHPALSGARHTSRDEIQKLFLGRLVDGDGGGSPCGGDAD